MKNFTIAWYQDKRGFNQLKDAALSGDRAKTNRLLSDTIIEAEKNVLPSILLTKIKQTIWGLENSKLSNLSDAISKEPPIFGKINQCF